MEQAIYFNGKDSRPHEVEVIIKDRGLSLKNDVSEINQLFPFENISLLTISKSDHFTLQLDDEFPSPVLQWEGPKAADFVNQFIKSKNKIKQAEFLITRKKPFAIISIGILVLATFIFSYVKFLSPFIGDQAVKILPKSVEEKAGEVVYGNMKPFISKDSTKTKLINEFYDVLGFESEYDIEITYSDTGMVNAFAVPGGKIVVFDGIVKRTENWQELAALLSHELAHVNQRHSFKMIARSSSNFMVISVLTGDVAGTSSVILENVSQFRNLANSRHFEKEADEYGLEYLKNSKIDPYGMVQLFKRIDAFSSEELGDLSKVQKGLEYMSTHPLGENRLNSLTQIIEDDPDFQYDPIEIERAKEIWKELKEIEVDKEAEE